MKMRNLSNSELKKIITQATTNSEFLLNNKMLLTLNELVEEEAIRKILNVSQKTMYNYRKAGLFDYVKIKGKVFYFKSLFVAQLLTR